ncbi:anthranilate phosphoribosyltransferase [Blochmannia endosymbiont of Colobopsis nipponica]|uniref:anthranilate phosphoribosyltransferase n=1 Tax=Blochmannia endosymbiont of Colobopsis nipponica TaxID=2681987 RepID=UPI00177B6553|nr:anthranilate phosphoribosyltransferase [Blochmannia endosymbiont of Colobopsis nipponica]QOI11029.1 anthranilate phosphoribosyltransferase [Blochmannia endosymbiont of Colobopsis nipponica]
MLENILEKLYQGKYINIKESRQLFENIIEGNISSIQLAGILIGIKVRGESSEEIAGASDVLLANAKPFPRPNYAFADITGTGGDCNNTINVSTISAIVAATCGAKIAKHGNHGISGKIGSADLIKQLNIPLDMSPEFSRITLDKLGICFLHAPYYHKSFKNTLSVRKKLKTTTLFNVIGPLINPAKPPLALIGVYKIELMEIMIKTLKLLKYRRAIVVHCNGTDEVMLHAPTQVKELNDSKIEEYTLTAKDFGLQPCEISKTSQQDKYLNAIRLLQGKGNHTHEKVIAANVAMLLKLFGHENLNKNVDLALNNIHNGTAYKHLMLLTEKRNKNCE